MSFLRALTAVLGGWRAAILAVLAVAAIIACLFLRGAAVNAGLRADAAEQRAQEAEGQVLALRQNLAIEREQAKRANEIAAQYEQDKRDAEAAGKRVADDLRAGSVRLREQWRGCEDRMSGVAPAPGEPDAAADDRAESAGRIVRAAREADDQIKRLQDFILSERK